MFDIGFTEILIIAVIALFVVGPERLPETVRSVGLWIGRLKRGMREARREFEIQVGADEIRRELHNEEVMKNLENLRKDVSDTLNEKIDVDEDADDENLYPPGHENHDPNNDIDDELGNPATNRPTPAPQSSVSSETDPDTSEPDAPARDKQS